MTHPQALLIPTKGDPFGPGGEGAGSGPNTRWGRYTGSGVSGKQVRFDTPISLTDHYLLFVTSGTFQAVFKTNAMAATASKTATGNGPTAAGIGILGVTETGFTLDTATTGNNPGTPYFYWLVTAPDSLLFCGSYTGTGVAGLLAPAAPLAFDPNYVVVLPQAGRQCCFRPLTLAGDASLTFSTTAPAAGFITSLTPAAGQFELGADLTVNTVAENFFFAAFAPALAQVISYTGDGGATNPNVTALSPSAPVTKTPNVVIVKSEATINALTKGASIPDPNSVWFRNGQAPASAGITHLTDPGFRVGVRTEASGLGVVLHALLVA